MASDHHFLISGNAPFSQDGIFEVELAISESKPSDTEIKTKSFSSIWKQNFHLKVKNGRFQETIGSHENPLPDSISSFSQIWIVVTDHSNVDYELIYDNYQLIIDTRNVFKNKNGNHIKRLGQG